MLVRKASTAVRKISRSCGEPLTVLSSGADECGEGMERHVLRIVVEAVDQATAGVEADALADKLREIDGVDDARRRKTDHENMDLGSVVDVVLKSGPILVAVAQTIALFKRESRTSVRVAKVDGESVEAEFVDPETAVRIIEAAIKNKQRPRFRPTA